MVSVIIPTYNRANMIKRAIDSVLRQTYQYFEIIVIDDGSNDDTYQVVQSINDSRIRYIRLDRTKGAAAARNEGILQANGELIAFLDSDDIWMSKKLEMQVNTFLNDDVGLCYTSILLIDEKGKVVGKHKATHSGYIFKKLLKKNIIGSASSVMVKRNCLDKCGLFDESLTHREDYDLWLRIAKHYKTASVRKTLTIQYVHNAFRLSTDFSKRITSYTYFLEKHKSEFGQHPKALGRQLYGLAAIYLRTGDKVNAKKLLWQSFKISPRIKTLVKLIKLCTVREVL